MTGNKFTIEDYQIVNGCQTSHVLYRERANFPAEEVLIPVKVIATADDGLTADIIRATNSQTAISLEDLGALTEYQKKIESYFNAFNERHKLYFKRRSKQYEGMSGIEKVRIVNRGQLIKAFASMFLDEPHRAGRYYPTLLKEISGRIFNESDRPEMYYVSAFAQYRLEFFFRNRQFEVAYKPARYHLLTALRHQIIGTRLPLSGSKEMEKKCNELVEVLSDDQKTLATLEAAAHAVDIACGPEKLDRDLVRTQKFRDAVVAAL